MTSMCLFHITEKLNSLAVKKTLLTAVDSILGVKNPKNILIIQNSKVIVHKRENLKLE